MHSRIVAQLNNILHDREKAPEWIAHGKTTLCQKDPDKGNADDNFRPISCLPLRWK